MKSCLSITECDGRGLAIVLVRQGKGPALAERVRHAFGVELPVTPCRRAAGGVAWSAIAPGGWLVSCDQGENAFADSLRTTLGDMASVTDYADSYVTLRFSGSGVRDLLCRLLPVDVHPRAFGIGCLAVTEAARIGATVWRLEDEVDGAPVFEIAVVRSMAECFRHAISEAAQDQSTLSGEGERWPEHVGTNAPTPSETRT